MCVFLSNDVGRLGLPSLRAKSYVIESKLFALAGDNLCKATMLSARRKIANIQVIETESVECHVYNYAGTAGERGCK